MYPDKSLKLVQKWSAFEQLILPILKPKCKTPLSKAKYEELAKLKDGKYC